MFIPYDEAVALATAPKTKSIVFRGVQKRCPKSLRCEAMIEAESRIWDWVVAWDPVKSAQFPRFLGYQVFFFVMDFLRTHGIGGRAKFSSVPISQLSEDGFDIPGDRLPVGWELDSQDAVEAMTRSLAPAVRNVTRSHYLQASGETIDRNGSIRHLARRSRKTYLYSGIATIRKIQQNPEVYI